MNYYILNGTEIKLCKDPLEWAKQFENSNRIIARNTKNNVLISTVFLGLDHSFGEGPPLVFETMIFGGSHDQYQDRYSTYNEALKGHKAACDLVTQELIK